MSAGVVAAFSIIGVIAALVGIVTPLISLIFKVALMIHSKMDYVITLYTRGIGSKYITLVMGGGRAKVWCAK